MDFYDALNIQQNNEIPENKPLFKCTSFSKQPSEDDRLEEHGVKLLDASNEKIRSHFPKLNEFISKWQNENPSIEDIESVFSDSEQLYNLLDGVSDAHKEVLNLAWTKLGSCAKIMSRNPKNSGIIFDFCRRVLLTCSKHAYPKPNPTYDLEFNHSSWTPYPRTEASQGLPWLAAVKCDREILNAIIDLASDKVPCVRYLLMREIFRISDNVPDEFWQLMESVVDNEKNQLVLQSMCYSLDYLVAKEETKTTYILEKLVNRISLSDQDNTLLEKTVPTVVFLALVRENKWAIDTYCKIIKEPTKYSKPLKRATFETVTFYLKPQMFNSITDSEVAKRAINRLLEIIDSVINGAKVLRFIPEKDENNQSKLRDMYEIIDEVVTRLYFAVDVSDKDTKKKEGILSEKQMRTFYHEIKPLLKHVLTLTSKEENIMLAHTAHYFMQLLNCALRYDPKGVLELAAKVAKSSQDANYNLDRMAIKEVVKLVEKILADYKLEIRNEDSIRDLLDLLDIFAKSGSPEALKLIWELDKVFR